jgi:hypothetical protein
MLSIPGESIWNHRLAQLPIIGLLIRMLLWLRYLGHIWGAEAGFLYQLVDRLAPLSEDEEADDEVLVRK